MSGRAGSSSGAAEDDSDEQHEEDDGVDNRDVSEEEDDYVPRTGRALPVPRSREYESDDAVESDIDPDDDDSGVDCEDAGYVDKYQVAAADTIDEGRARNAFAARIEITDGKNIDTMVQGEIIQERLKVGEEMEAPISGLEPMEEDVKKSMRTDILQILLQSRYTIPYCENPEDEKPGRKRSGTRKSVDEQVRDEHLVSVANSIIMVINGSVSAVPIYDTGDLYYVFRVKKGGFVDSDGKTYDKCLNDMPLKKHTESDAIGYMQHVFASIVVAIKRNVQPIVEDEPCTFTVWDEKDKRLDMERHRIRKHRRLTAMDGSSVQINDGDILTDVVCEFTARGKTFQFFFDCGGSEEGQLFMAHKDDNLIKRIWSFFTPVSLDAHAEFALSDLNDFPTKPEKWGESSVAVNFGEELRYNRLLDQGITLDIDWGLRQRGANAARLDAENHKLLGKLYDRLVDIEDTPFQPIRILNFFQAMLMGRRDEFTRIGEYTDLDVSHYFALVEEQYKTRKGKIKSYYRCGNALQSLAAQLVLVFYSNTWDNTVFMSHYLLSIFLEPHVISRTSDGKRRSTIVDILVKTDGEGGVGASDKLKTFLGTVMYHVMNSDQKDEAGEAILPESVELATSTHYYIFFKERMRLYCFWVSLDKKTSPRNRYWGFMKFFDAGTSTLLCTHMSDNPKSPLCKFTRGFHFGIAKNVVRRKANAIVYGVTVSNTEIPESIKLRPEHIELNNIISDFNSVSFDRANLYTKIQILERRAKYAAYKVIAAFEAYRIAYMAGVETVDMSTGLKTVDKYVELCRERENGTPTQAQLAAEAKERNNTAQMLYDAQVAYAAEMRLLEEEAKQRRLLKQAENARIRAAKGLPPEPIREGPEMIIADPSKPGTVHEGQGGSAASGDGSFKAPRAKRVIVPSIVSSGKPGQESGEASAKRHAPSGGVGCMMGTGVTALIDKLHRRLAVLEADLAALSMHEDPDRFLSCD